MENTKNLGLFTLYKFIFEYEGFNVSGEYEEIIQAHKKNIEKNISVFS